MEALVSRAVATTNTVATMLTAIIATTIDSNHNSSSEEQPHLSKHTTYYNKH